LLLTATAGVQAGEAGHAWVRVEFGTPADPPLVKKFGLMNSGIVPIARHRRDLPLLEALRAESLRIDLSIGKRDAGWTREIVDGTPSRLTY
jgi:hypothetical protein